MWNTQSSMDMSNDCDAAPSYENGSQGEVCPSPSSQNAASPAISEPAGASAPVESVQYYEQNADLVAVGPGGIKEAILLGVCYPKLNSKQKDELARAKKYGMEQSIKAVLMKQTVQHQQQQQKLAMYAQAMSLMARVYIGSISFELREETVKNAFLPFGPIKSINMSWDSVTGHHKGFAFLEYEVPESATLAQEQMNGILIGGRNIKVGRPSNMPQAQPIIESIMEEAKLHHRIFVSSIHSDLTEQDIKSVFEAFGAIINVELPKGLQGKHKGFAYIDFDNEKSALDAVASMNLFDLGGQFLRVGRAITPPMAQTTVAPPVATTLPTAAAVAAAAVTAKIQALDPLISSPTSSPDMSTAAVPRPGRTLSPCTVPGVPPPGVAIPQIPSQPTLVTPVLYSAVQTDKGAAGAAAQININTGPSPQLPVSTATPDVPQAAKQPETVAVAPSPPSAVSTGQMDSDQTQRLLQNSSSGDRQAKVMEVEATQTLASQEDLKIKGNEARNVLMHKLMRRFESRVLVLRNMVGPEDVDEYLQEEVTEECSRFGEVEQAVIYQEQPCEGADSNAVVKVFIKYSTVQEAEKAQSAFNGRYFSGRQIKAELYDQTMFDLNDLSG